LAGTEAMVVGLLGVVVGSAFASLTTAVLLGTAAFGRTSWIWFGLAALMGIGLTAGGPVSPPPRGNPPKTAGGGTAPLSVSPPGRLDALQSRCHLPRPLGAPFLGNGEQGLPDHSCA